MRIRASFGIQAAREYPLLYSTASSVGLSDEQPQGPITYLAPGDVISFDGPISGGHAAIVSAVSGSSMTMVNQNTASSSTISYGTLSDGTFTLKGWKGYNAIGVIHAPVAHGAPGITSFSASPSPLNARLMSLAGAALHGCARRPRRMVIEVGELAWVIRHGVTELVHLLVEHGVAGRRRCTRPLGRGTSNWLRRCSSSARIPASATSCFDATPLGWTRHCGQQALIELPEPITD